MCRLRFVYFVLLAGLPIGCASSPKPDDSGPAAVFNHPVKDVQRAAVDALTVSGFDIKKQESGHVEGARPRKVGLVVGSGGETVGVWLKATAPTVTEVRVKTAKSFVGGAGQKTWDKVILAEMTKSLEH